MFIFAQEIRVFQVENVQTLLHANQKNSFF